MFIKSLNRYQSMLVNMDCCYNRAKLDKFFLMYTVEVSGNSTRPEPNLLDRLVLWALYFGNYKSHNFEDKKKDAPWDWSTALSHRPFNSDGRKNRPYSVISSWIWLFTKQELYYLIRGITTLWSLNRIKILIWNYLWR